MSEEKYTVKTAMRWIASQFPAVGIPCAMGPSAPALGARVSASRAREAR